MAGTESILCVVQVLKRLGRYPHCIWQPSRWMLFLLEKPIFPPLYLFSWKNSWEGDSYSV